MKFRILGLLGALTLALALAVACGDDDDGGDSDGGGGGTSLEAYFERVGKISDDVNGLDDELTGKYPQAFSDPGETRDYYDEFLPAVNDALDEFKDLDPPEEAQDAHDEFVAALDDFLQALNQVAGDLQDVDTEDELQEFFQDRSDDVGAKSDRFGTACSRLQQLADDNDISVDLKCEDGGDGDGNGGDGGGGDGGMSLDEYLLGIDTIFDDADQEVESLQQELNDALGASETVDDQIIALDTFLASSVETFETAVDEMDALAAPADAQDSHIAFLSAASEVIDLSNQLRDELPGVTTGEELDELVNQFDFEVSQLTEEADAACFDLQDLADENGIDVDLDCED